MASLGVNSTQLRVVINRWHRRDEEIVQELKTRIKIPVLARLPNDFRQANQAINSGVPLCKNNGDPLGTKFRQLARQLTGITPSVEEKGGILSKLFFSSPMRQRSKRRIAPVRL